MSRTAAVDGVGAAVEADEDQLTSEQVCQQAGITYRQLDYWARAGHVPPPATRSGRAGSGFARRWTKADADRVAEVASLVRAGFTVQAAARYAAEAAPAT